MSDLILRQEDIDRFTDTLTKIIQKAQVSLAALIHRDGHLLASAGQTGAVDATALSALVSANFSSTVAIANLIGEREFSTQQYAGREKSIFLALVDEQTFLVSVFGVSIPLGPVRASCDEYRPALVKSLEKLYKNEPDIGLPTGDDIVRRSDELIDAEQAARAARNKPAAGHAVPRRLNYTGRPVNREALSASAVQATSDQPRRIKEPDGDDADLEALARAITSRRERESSRRASAADAAKRAEEPKSADKPDTAKADVMYVDGKPMSVISLKERAKSGKAG